MLARFIIFLLLNFGGLALGSLSTKAGVSSQWYVALQKAPWTPPGWVFGVAWSVIMLCFSYYMAKLLTLIQTNTALRNTILKLCDLHKSKIMDKLWPIHSHSFQTKHPIHYPNIIIHFMRKPLHTIISGFHYHYKCPERWTMTPIYACKAHYEAIRTLPNNHSTFCVKHCLDLDSLPQTLISLNKQHKQNKLTLIKHNGNN